MTGGVRGGGKGRALGLGDVGEVGRGYSARAEGRRGGVRENAIGRAVAMKDGGGIRALGENLDAEFKRLQATLPAGLTLSKVSDQPAAVEAGVGEFVQVLIEALVIVLLVSFFSLGARTGLVVAV